MADAPAIFDHPLCVVDVESWHPGSKGERHRLIEVAAVVVDERGYPGATWASLCRPRDLPRGLRAIQGNTVPAAALYATTTPTESDAVQAFAEWHYAHGGLDLIAYNCPFDRGALGGALAEAQGWDRADVSPTWPLPWGPCLMQTAKKILGKQQSKELAAAQALPDPRQALAWMARRVGYAGSLDMHRALPDALIEAALLVALRRRELAASPAAAPPARSTSSAGAMGLRFSGATP
jgi:DNA polymerase III epsilon subunit-like protein